MITLDDGTIVEADSDHEPENENVEEEGPIEDFGDQDVSSGDELFVAIRSLSAHVSTEDEQRLNIFHSRCKVQGKICMLIADGGSSANCVSTLLVDHLKLPTT